MSSYSFSPVNWGGQGPSPTTGRAQSDAGSGKRTAANRARAKGSAMPQPLMGPVHPVSGFEQVNNFVAAVQSGDGVAATALLVYGSSAVSRAVATGRLARGRRR